MMFLKNMKEKILEIIQSIRPEIEFDASKRDLSLFGVLDSLDIILLVDDLEAQLGITIDPEHITPENFSSLDTLDELVRSLSK